jgi:hypothetical protein
LRDELIYAIEKFHNVVHALAVHPGEIKERLRQAYSELHAVDRNRPIEIAEDVTWIFSRFRIVKDAEEGSATASVQAMTEDEAMELADKMWEVYDALLVLEKDERT